MLKGIHHLDLIGGSHRLPGASRQVQDGVSAADISGGMFPQPPLLASVHDAGFLRGFFDLPFHPAVVHFPIALLTIAWVLIYVRHWRARADLEPFIGASLGVGVASLPVTVLTGLRDARWMELLVDWEWDDPLTWHVLFALGATVVFSAHFVYRRSSRSSGALSARRDVVLASSGFWLLLMAGFIAAEVVHA